MLPVVAPPGERKKDTNEKKRQRSFWFVLSAEGLPILEESERELRLLSSTTTNKVCQGTENPSPWPLNVDGINPIVA